VALDSTPTAPQYPDNCESLFASILYLYLSKDNYKTLPLQNEVWNNHSNSILLRTQQAVVLTS